MLNIYFIQEIFSKPHTRYKEVEKRREAISSHAPGSGKHKSNAHNGVFYITEVK